MNLSIENSGAEQYSRRFHSENVGPSLFPPDVHTIMQDCGKTVEDLYIASALHQNNFLPFLLHFVYNK